MRYSPAMYADHLDLTLPLWWTVDDVLTAAQCAAYIAQYHQQAAEIAPVVGKDGVGVDLAVRNNTRVMWDDRDQADGLVRAVGATVPAQWHGERLVGGNPRLRLYCYQPGQHHSAHWDTVVELAGRVNSRMTLVLYLNDDFQGGATEFPELNARVTPQRGRALLFQHRVLHAATPVTRGAKFVLRTDLLFQGT